MNYREKLRELAENSPAKQWEFNCALHTDGRIWVDELDCGILLKTAEPPLRGKMSELIRYIAAANPSVILSLLDELDRREQKIELAYRKLMSSHYRRQGGLAGQAFTEWTCFRCDKEDCHPNTNTPLFCRECVAEIKRRYEEEKNHQKGVSE